VDLMPARVALNLRESGAVFPCKWCSVAEIYICGLFLRLLPQNFIKKTTFFPFDEIQTLLQCVFPLER
ncbi:hypothetical protein, partial [Oscillibacter sp. ER4]|uniref:hypothetical protein n=1 Tax=Oscillibacter sp. ER4 TaxID=1519439 RepID=UPI0019D37BF7